MPAAFIAVVAVASSGLAYLALHDDASEVRLVALPASSSEAAAIDALEAAGVEGIVGAVNAIVPLSDFSRVVGIPYLNAAERTVGDDPRRTPLLDALGARFTVRGPDGEPWNVFYVPGSDRSRDAVLARTLSGLGGDWAWDAPARQGNPRLLSLPALAWVVWLVVRKPRQGRLGRALLTASWLPLLAHASIASTALFVALGTASVIADRWVRSGTGKRLFRVLWPYAVAVPALLGIDPRMAPYVAASLALTAGSSYARPRLERFAGRNRLHDPPVFRALTMTGASDYARRISRGMIVPLIALLALAAFMPAIAPDTSREQPSFRIEREKRSSIDDPETLLEEHLEFQTALTYGRIGDYKLGEPGYTPAYRYTEEAGRMKRVDPAGGDEGPAPVESFASAALALSGSDPSSVARVNSMNGAVSDR